MAQRIAKMSKQLTIQICHFPPGTSKWNKIEHRMFCHITSQKPRSCGQFDRQHTSEQGLKIKAALDENLVYSGDQNDEEMECTVNRTR